MTNRISEEALKVADVPDQPSAAEQQWSLIAAKMRETLARTVLDKMPSMDAHGQLALSQTAMTLYWLEHNAACFDKWTDLELMRVFPS